MSAFVGFLPLRHYGRPIHDSFIVIGEFQERLSRSSIPILVHSAFCSNDLSRKPCNVRGRFADVPQVYRFGPVLPMPHFRCFLWRSVLSLLCVFPGVCAAQAGQQFLNVPEVEPTGGRVTSFLTGTFQNPPDSTDILYIGAPTVSGTSSTIVAGVLLYHQGFNNIAQNRITFQNVSNAVATLGDFDSDQHTDFAFALTPVSGHTITFCVYYGTGATALSQQSAFSGSSKDGCAGFTPLGSNPPNLAYIAAVKPLPGALPELLIEDAANNILYIFIFSNSGATGSNGLLTGFALRSFIMLAHGAGPISTGDFNRDGKNDIIVNGQTNFAADVYLGDGNGGFPTGNSYIFSNHVHSLLIEDMDLDGIPDMVVEADSGVIEIHKGIGDGTWTPASVGGTAVGVGVDGFSGNGGHLAAINPTTLDILTTTPIGLSVLHNNGGLNYSLKGIYNIGPGRTSFALVDFFNDGHLDLAVDSAEGIAIVPGDANGDGGFQTSRAYAALLPALSATVGRFRNAQNSLDVVVATGATQAQLLTGNGDGTFDTYPGPVDSGPGPANVPATLWSNILSGDFDGDGKLDILYSFTGLPQPGPSGSTFPVLYIQYGNGDGTFGSSGFSWSLGAVPGVNSSILYPESAVGDFNGDAVADIANSGAEIEGDLLGIRGSHGLSAGLVYADLPNPAFNQVAAGFFKVNRTSKQDLVFQLGSTFSTYVNSGDGIHFTGKGGLFGAAAPHYASTVLLTDVDGDGNGDVVVVYYTANPIGGGPVAPNQLYIWYGNGDGTFGAPQIINLSRDYYLGAVADMNGDGRPDIILSDGSLVGILYNQGSRSFGGEQHFLAGQGVNSLSVADVNGDGEPDLIVANGGITISNPIALGGATQSSLALTPNPDVNTGGITVLLNNIVSKPVTGTLAATPEPSNFQATFTLTATLTPSTGVPPPTGTVQFSIDGTAVGAPVILVAGTAASTASTTIPAGNAYITGTHTIAAAYSGDALNSPLNLSGSHVIQGGATTTALNLCVGPTPACPSNGFVSPPFVPALTMVYGQTYNGTATVTPSDANPLTGTTQFFDLYNGVSNLLCTLQTQTGGTCPPSVGSGAQVGVHVFTAVYVPGPSDTHTGSTSPTVTITVTQDTNTATLTGSPNPSPVGQPVTFTATFTGNAAPPTGAVTFLNGGAAIGTATLTPGATGFSSTATLTTSTLPVGTDPITASYAATLSFAAATTPVFNEVITPLPTGSFTLTVTPNPATTGVGFATALTVKVTANNGFAQAVTLACGTMPSEATCIFVNPTIAAGGGSTTLFVNTTAPHTCGTTQPYFLGLNGGSSIGGSGLAPLALPALAGVAVMFIPGKRRWLRALVAMIAIAGATQITGCGNCTDLGTRPATYTFQVTATAAAGPAEVEAQTVTLKVTI